MALQQSEDAVEGAHPVRRGGTVHTGLAMRTEMIRSRNEACEIGQAFDMLFNLIKRTVIMAVVVPLAAAGARKLSDVVEARRGPNRGTRMLRQGADLLRGRLDRPRSRARFGWGR